MIAFRDITSSDVNNGTDYHEEIERCAVGYGIALDCDIVLEAKRQNRPLSFVIDDWCQREGIGREAAINDWRGLTNPVPKLNIAVTKAEQEAQLAAAKAEEARAKLQQVVTSWDRYIARYQKAKKVALGDWPSMVQRQQDSITGREAWIEANLFNEHDQHRIPVAIDGLQAARQMVPIYVHYADRARQEFEKLVEEIKAFAKEHGIPKEKLEGLFDL